MSRRPRIDDARARRLPFIHFGADSAIWALSIPLAIWLRFDYDTSYFGSSTFVAIFAAIVLQAEFGIFLGQYRGKWRYGSFDEVRGVAGAAFGTGVVLTVLLWREESVPRSVPVLATGFALLGHVAVRSTWRLYKDRANRPTGDHLLRTVLVGAGDGADQILKTILSSPSSMFKPVAIVDDDPVKRNLQLSGVSVMGTVDQLVRVARHFDAEAVLIAMPSADGAFIGKVTTEAEADGLDVFVLPPVDQLLGVVDARDIRPVEHADLLGRAPADIDTTLVAEYISGQRVMVTGAGGSIGSELCRQLAKFGPSQLLMLDRDENGLHATQLSVYGRALLDDTELILADIRDADRVDEIFAHYQPDVVFHTAALKHLPLLEMHAEEGWKTNVCGSLNLLRAAGRHGVTKFVNVSTDKAANPTSVLGWTKRITERLTAHANETSTTQFVSVRFGNVLGSNGSVLKAFEAQAASGGPLTVTHPDITRYFMTIEEASRLTIYAGAIGAPGEVMILDMGDPVKIIDVAQRFANLRNPPLEIEFTGLRHNEKLHEDLIADGEAGERRHHELITHVHVAPLAPTSEMWDGSALGLEDMITVAMSHMSKQATP